MPEITFKVTNQETGHAFTVRIVEVGQYFGRGHCLLNEGDTLVEIFDATQGQVQDTEGNTLGCSIGRPVRLAALMEEIYTAPSGQILKLHPTVAKWSLDSAAMMELMGHVSRLNLIEEMPLA
jgi:hypothetical protein